MSWLLILICFSFLNLRLMQNLLKCLPSGNSSTSDPSSFLYLSSIDLPGILSHLPNILTPERKTSIIQHTMCRYFYFLATVVILENQKGKKCYCFAFPLNMKFTWVPFSFIFIVLMQSIDKSLYHLQAEPQSLFW